LGEDSVNAVQGHAEQLLKDLALWRKVGIDTKVDA
jgi:hypothetical protein